MVWKGRIEVRIMKWTLALALLPLASIARPVMAQAPASVRLELSIAKPEIKSGDAVEAIVRLTNVSDHTVSYLDTAGIPLFGMTIRREDGAGIEETDFRRSLRCPEGEHCSRSFNHVVTESLKSGESLTRKVDLSKEFVLSATGVYLVYAQIGDPQTRMKVLSNEVRFTVTPK